MTDFKPLFNDIFAGSDIIPVMAGPCSAEGRDQVLNTARALAAEGIRVFRAGVWKPRTKPGGFEGIGTPALQWLADARKETGMLVGTEIATRQHLMDAIIAGMDYVWIGARTSANPFAVQEIADTLASLPDERREGLTVLVKNPVNPDLELWIGALQRIYRAGIRRLGAIHRGFSTYGNHIYRNLPQWRIPIELHRRYPALPIICDPSLIGVKRELIASLSQQALDMGFNGLIIESHCEPDCALSDKDQQITPEVLNVVLNTLVRRDRNCTTESLSQLRRQIDHLDDELIELLAKRMAVCREVGHFKAENSMPVVQSGRYNDLMQRRVDQAEQVGLSPDFMRSVLAAIHEESVRQQLEITSRNVL